MPRVHAFVASWKVEIMYTYWTFHNEKVWDFHIHWYPFIIVVSIPKRYA